MWIVPASLTDSRTLPGNLPAWRKLPRDRRRYIDFALGLNATISPLTRHESCESWPRSPGLLGAGKDGDRGRALFRWSEHGHPSTIVVPKLCQSVATGKFS